MSLTPGLNLPFGIQPINPVPVDSWSGPYTGLTEGAALALANSAITPAIRFQTMEARIVVAGVGKKFWYRDGILDGDLVEFASGSGSTGNFLPLSGGTVTGDSYFTQGLSAFTFSAGTINSGSTNLYDIFLSGPQTYVQPGLNTYTGGTSFAPTVNISAATLSYISATTISGGTINSGSTNLYNIFAPIGLTALTGNFIPMTGTGANLVTGDVTFDDGVNIAWTTGNDFLQYNPGSTNVELATSNGFDLTSGSMMSAGTDLYNIFLTTTSTASTVAIQNGLNTYTGGTAALPTVNISAATLSYISATTFSAATINSGSTNLYDIFAPIGLTALTGNFIPMTGTGANLVTGDITIDDAVNLSWNATNETLQYNPGTTNIELTTSNGFDLVTGAMMSAGTDLYNIFLTTSTGGTGFSGWTSSTGVNSIKLNDSTNLASGNFSLAGGKGNSATTTYATVVGGQNNKSSGLWSFVGAGNSNTASGLGSFIGGGRENSATTSYSTIVGGRQNLSSGVRSFIGSGYRNSATTSYSAVVGGKQNLASGQFSAILNGSGNTVSGSRSAVIGGISISGGSNDTVYVPYFNIQSANTNNVLTSILVKDANGDIYLRDASSLSGATGNFIPMTGTGANLVTGDITIDDAVNLSWNATNETLQYNPGTTNVELATSNGFDLTSGMMMSAGTDLYNIFLTTSTGGTGFSGWTSSTGVNSIIANNGTINLASNTYSSVLNGNGNSATTFYSTIVNGYKNLASGVYSFIGGGWTNSATTRYSFIGNGYRNLASGEYATIVGGNGNKIIGDYSFVGGGSYNIIKGGASSIVGGDGNYTNVFNKQFIGGGLGNSGQSGYAVIVGGLQNVVSGYHGAVLHGKFNTASGQFSTVIGGGSHTVSGNRSAVIAGSGITATADDTVYVPFLNIQSANTNNVLTSILVRDTNGDVYLRDASTLSGGTGSTSADTYTNATATPVTIGGIPAGSTFSAQTMQQMWDALLYPYQTPAFTSFSRTNLSSTYELGEMLLTGSQTFNWSTSNSGNVSANTISIVQNISPVTTLLSNSANDGTEVISVSTAYSAGTSSTVTLYTITAYNSLNSPFSTTISRSWRPRIYYGTSATSPLVEADIEGLANNPLASGFAGTYSFAAGNYKYFCYPSSFGTATVFVDTGTNFNVAMEPVYVVSVTNIFGVTQNYNVHRTTNVLGGSINIQIS